MFLLRECGFAGLCSEVRLPLLIEAILNGELLLF